MRHAMQAKKDNAGPFGARCANKPRTANDGDAPHGSPWRSFKAFDCLVSAIDVQVIALSECVVEQGFTLDLNACETPSFHYIKEGHGQLYTANDMLTKVGPQTLILVPPRCPFRFEPRSTSHPAVESSQELRNHSPTRTMTCMLSGRFRSLYGNSAELFDTLQAPVIERFSEDDALESRLQHALGELISRDVCSDVMVSTDVKLVMVALLRHSFLSLSSWTRCLAALPVAEYGPARGQVNQYRDNIG